MVQLEEVEDEEFDRVQVGEKDFNDDDDFTDTGNPPNDHDRSLALAGRTAPSLRGCYLSSVSGPQPVQSIFRSSPLRISHTPNK